uniref:Uncharacterized protein n=1 Tax=Escherichia coli TaxID=562 RepID=A0A075MJA6_ECOLX|nr:hypothetical protein [Escherichia coli]
MKRDFPRARATHSPWDRKKAGLTSRLFCACLSPPSAVPVKMPC